MTERGGFPDGDDLRVVGRLIEASNATFLAEDADGVRYVYKPVRGEAPLWDFPTGTLGRREVAAYELSASAGFDVVPETHMVDTGPAGRGSLQRWIDPDDVELVDLVRRNRIPEGWFGVVIGLDADDRDVALVHADDDRLRRLALFDVIANNADRKAGHIIVGADGRVFGVDHGVTFHQKHKLRTVLWGFAGDPLTDDERALVERALEAAASGVLEEWLAPHEIDATFDRATALLEQGCFPEPGDRWPVIPWPPI